MFASQLRVRIKFEQEDSRLKAEEIRRQLSLLRQQQNRPLNLRLLEEIDEKTMAEKATELRDREANFKLQLDACDLGRQDNGEIAVKTFELRPRRRNSSADNKKALRRSHRRASCLV